MSFNTTIDWKTCSDERQAELLMRPAISASESITRTVAEILDNVKARGDRALREYSAKFDKTEVGALQVTAEQEITDASDRLGDDIKQAMAVAVKNIDTFHTAQKLPTVDVETLPGVRCQQVTRPVASVGLYIPGGSAPLFSTVLMLATPARIAGCQKVVLCSPPPIADEILYAAQLCGVQEVFKVGGAQAIAALAFGTESVPKVDKIFGPGNAFVTEAKRQVSQRLDGAAIDMPAGPSEVLVIADSGATPEFVASDLLSQAEHGPDSQVILLTPDAAMAKRVGEAVERQLADLPRADTARQALAASRLIVARDLPEVRGHLQPVRPGAPDYSDPQRARAGRRHHQRRLGVPRRLVAGVRRRLRLRHQPRAADLWLHRNLLQPGAGGFPETHDRAGTLPRRVSATLAATIETLAAAERLTAHKNAVTLRVAALKEQA